MLALHVFAHESIHALAESIASGVVANDLSFVQRYLPDLLKVTADDVKRITKKYLVEHKSVIIESVAPEKADRGFAPPMSLGARIAKEEPAKKGGGFDLKSAKTVVLENGLKPTLLKTPRLPIVVPHANVGHVRL